MALLRDGIVLSAAAAKPTALERFGASDRFRGIFCHFDGRPFAAVRGDSAVFLGVSSLLEARHVMRTDAREDIGEDGFLPSIKQMVTMLEYTTSDRAGTLRREITYGEAADPELLRLATRESEWRLASVRAMLNEARTRELQRELRRDIKRYQHPERWDPRCHALIVGAATYDLRVIRHVLRALSVRRGVIYATGAEFRAAEITTKKGVAVVMPFRANAIETHEEEGKDDE